MYKFRYELARTHMRIGGTATEWMLTEWMLTEWMLEKLKEHAEENDNR